MEVYPIEIIDGFCLQNCVLCGSISEEKNADIFKNSGIELKLQKYINEYLQIKIEEDDGLPHGVCVSCVKILNAFHQLLKTSQKTYRKLKKMRDAFQVQAKVLAANVKKTITIDGIIETMPCDSLPSPVSNVPSPVGSEQEILYELDSDVTMEDLQSDSKTETPSEATVDATTTEVSEAVTAEDVSNVEIEIVKMEEYSTSDSKMEPPSEVPVNATTTEETCEAEVSEAVTAEDVSNVEIETVEMEEYSTLIPLAKGSQLAYIYVETNAYVLNARLHVVIININKAVPATHGKLQETIARITVDVKRHIKKINEETRKSGGLQIGPDITAQFLCLTCRCSFYCKEEMVAHFGSLHPTELRQCSLCPEQVCGPDDVFDKHLEFHKAVDTNDLELMLELTSTHTLEIPEPEYIFFTLGNINPQLISYVKDGSKLQESLNEHDFINPDMPMMLLFGLQNFLSKHMPDKRVKCEFCKKFIKDELYSNHLFEVHPSTTRHPCPHCGIMIEESEVEFHVKHRHKGGKLLYCNICDAQYKTTNLDQPHMFLKNADKVYTCSVETCKRMFSTQKQYRSHFFRHRKEIPPVAVLCDLCGKMQRSKRGLKLHLVRTHFSQKKKDVEYICDICCKVYETKPKMKRHLRYCQGEKLPCDICGKQYVKAILNQHRKTHRDASERFPCKYCGRLFILRVECESHELTHEGFQLKCTICKPQRRFRTVSNVEKHRRDHERGEIFQLPPPMPTAQCQLCFLVLKNKRNLDLHMQAHARKGSSAQPKKGGRFNVEALELACYVCLVRYGTQEQFDEHMEAYHPHGVPTPDPIKFLAKCFSFQCSFCPKKVKKFDVFKDHEASHRGEKNYSCKYCKKKFFYGNERLQHMKNCEYKS